MIVEIDVNKRRRILNKVGFISLSINTKKKRYRSVVREKGSKIECKFVRRVNKNMCRQGLGFPW